MGRNATRDNQTAISRDSATAEQGCHDAYMQEPPLKTLDILDVRHDGVHLSVNDELAGEHVETVIPRDFADALVHTTQRFGQLVLIVDRDRPALQPARLIGGWLCTVSRVARHFVEFDPDDARREFVLKHVNEQS